MTTLARFAAVVALAALAGAARAEPRVFAEGIVSTVDDDVGGSFSPDGNELYFARFVPYTTFPRIGIMLVTVRRDGRWGPPQVLPFSGTHLDFPPRLDPSGRRMLFASSRPLPDGARGAIRIWEAERTAAGWGDPRPLPPPINAPGVGWNADPSVASDGTLYFSSDRGSPGSPHIYRARFVDGKWGEPEKLGPAVNSDFTDDQPYISPDGKTLLFSSTGLQGPPYPHRPGELQGGGKPYPRGDLYVSFARDGAWTPARHLDHGINTVAEEGFPFLSPDGKVLYFTSERSPFTVPTARRLTYETLEEALRSIYNGHGNVFSIGADALEVPR
jgi:hypothetical protein